MWMKRDEGSFGYVPPKMSDKQMAALEKHIKNSKDATDFSKKVIIWTLRKTENLTKSVAVSIWDKDFGELSTKEVQDGAHAMESSNRMTRLDIFMTAMGTEVGLCHHCGCFVSCECGVCEQKSNILILDAPGRTIWFSHIFYDRKVTVLPQPTKEELDKISLDIN